MKTKEKKVEGSLRTSGIKSKFHPSGIDWRFHGAGRVNLRSTAFEVEEGAWSIAVFAPEDWSYAVPRSKEQKEADS